jgi:hypothetical protein
VLLHTADGGAAVDAEDREEAGQAIQEAPPRPLQVPQGTRCAHPLVAKRLFTEHAAPFVNPLAEIACIRFTRRKSVHVYTLI